MTPNYSQAASALFPLVPVYAVNCGEELNKNLCAEQGVESLPTIKVCFAPSHLTRSLNSFFAAIPKREFHGFDSV